MLKGDCNKCIHRAADPADKVCVECGIARKHFEEETMAEYISREAAKQFICRACEACFCRPEKCNTLMDFDRQLPAADVAPVVHAHWEDVSVDDEGSMLIASMFCPVCKQWHSEVCAYGKPTKMAHYCPNCGAKMDESEAKMDESEDDNGT